MKIFYFHDGQPYGETEVIIAHSEGEARTFLDDSYYSWQLYRTQEIEVGSVYKNFGG